MSIWHRHSKTSMTLMNAVKVEHTRSQGIARMINVEITYKCPDHDDLEIITQQQVTPPKEKKKRKTRDRKCTEK